MQRNKVQAVSVAAALVGWSGLVAPRLPGGLRVPVQAALSGALAVATATPLGARPPALWRGLRWGGAAAAVVVSGMALLSRHPRVRAELAGRDLPKSVSGWLLVYIPIGTVWSEEVAFRGVLGGLAADAYGPRWGRALTAAAFGLSHVADARGAGEPVSGVVVATGAAGWLFGLLHERSDSLVAPMVAHLAVNEAGAVAALRAQRG